MFRIFNPHQLTLSRLSKRSCYDSFFGFFVDSYSCRFAIHIAVGLMFQITSPKWFCPPTY